MIPAANVFVSTLAVQFKNTLARPMFQVVLVVQPLVVTTTAYMAYRNTSVANSIALIVLGGGLAGIWAGLTFSSVGDINRERAYGTLLPIMAAPSSPLLIFNAKIIANTLLSLLALVLSFAYSVLFLGVDIAAVHWLPFSIALTAFLFSASTFALCLASIFLLSRSTQIMQNFLEFPLFLLAGLAFPVTSAPVWVQLVSVILPMRWGSEALRQAFSSGAAGPHFWELLAATGGLGLLYYMCAFFLFRRIEQQVRKDGTLELI